MIAMEEISWGQMVFNWQSPDWFMGSNSQQETSLHNIKGINSSVDVAFLIGLLGLTVGSVLTHLSIAVSQPDLAPGATSFFRPPIYWDFFCLHWPSWPVWSLTRASGFESCCQGKLKLLSCSPAWGSRCRPAGCICTGTRPKP